MSKRRTAEQIQRVLREVERDRAKLGTLIAMLRSRA